MTAKIATAPPATLRDQRRALRAAGLGLGGSRSTPDWLLMIAGAATATIPQDPRAHGGCVWSSKARASSVPAKRWLK